jgi:hypothetical protein
MPATFSKEEFADWFPKFVDKTQKKSGFWPDETKDESKWRTCLKIWLMSISKYDISYGELQKIGDDFCTSPPARQMVMFAGVEEQWRDPASYLTAVQNLIEDYCHRRQEAIQAAAARNTAGKVGSLGYSPELSMEECDRRSVDCPECVGSGWAVRDFQPAQLPYVAKFVLFCRCAAGRHRERHYRVSHPVERRNFDDLQDRPDLWDWSLHAHYPSWSLTKASEDPTTGQPYQDELNRRIDPDGFMVDGQWIPRKATTRRRTRRFRRPP